MNRRFSLKKNHEIDKIVKIKQSVGNRFYAIYFIKTNNQVPKIAISVSKKYKTAVSRNYEKRVLKEIFRLTVNEYKYLSMLIVVKLAAKELSFTQKSEQIHYLLKKVIKELNNEKN